MDDERLAMLVTLVTDRASEIAERDDAAIYLGESDDPRAVGALLDVGSQPDEDEVLLASCGESLGEIAVRRQIPVGDWASKLTPVAAHELTAIVSTQAPELLDS